MTGRIDIFVERLLALAARQLDKHYNLPGLEEEAAKLARYFSGGVSKPVNPLVLRVCQYFLQARSSIDGRNL